MGGRWEVTGSWRGEGSIQGHSLFLKVLGDLVTQSCWSRGFQPGGQPAWALFSTVVDFFFVLFVLFSGILPEVPSKMDR